MNFFFGVLFMIAQTYASGDDIKLVNVVISSSEEVKSIGTLSHNLCEHICDDSAGTVKKSFSLRRRNGGVLSRSGLELMREQGLLVGLKKHELFNKLVQIIGKDEAIKQVSETFYLLNKDDLLNDENIQSRLVGINSKELIKSAISSSQFETEKLLTKLIELNQKISAEKVDPVSTTLAVIAVSDVVLSKATEIVKHDYENHLIEARRNRDVSRLETARQYGEAYVVMNVLSVGLASINVIGGVKTVGQLIGSVIQGAATGSFTVSMSSSDVKRAIASEQSQIEESLRRERIQREMEENQRRMERELNEQMRRPERYRDHVPGADTSRTC